MRITHTVSGIVGCLLALSLGLNASSALGDTAKDRERERAEAALAIAKSVVAEYETVTDRTLLAQKSARIERAWNDLTYYHGTDASVTPMLAVLRARATTSTGSKAHVVEAWDTALKVQPNTLAPNQWLALNVAAAEATASVGEIILSSRYFASARTFAFAANRDALALQLRLRLQELVAIGGQIPWRQLRDKMADMRRFSEGFTLWNVPRLEALLGEAELRLAYQPEDDEKRLDIANLKAQIELAEKGMAENVRPAYIERVRAFYYTIEDRYDL